MRFFHFGRVFNPEYVPMEGAAIVVSNHQSFFDPVLIGYGLERELDYMARDSLFKNRFFSKLIRSLNAFPVKRGRADTTAIKETLRRLKAGRVVLLFPEASRTHNGQINPFRPGIGLLAKKASVPIVPAAIAGAFEAWPRTRKLPRLFTPIYVMFAPPILPEEYKDLSDEELTLRIHKEVCRIHNILRGKLSLPSFPDSHPKDNLDSDLPAQSD